jgi:hypothetical protein
MNGSKPEEEPVPDPITLAALGAVALSEGVKFLYGQAGELLKRRREQRASAALPPDLFEAPPGELVVDPIRADELEPELRDLRRKLSEYGQGVDDVDPGDTEVVEAIDALRRVLEAVYRQPIVFRGEHRPDGSPDLTGEATVGDVRGYVAGLRAGRIRSGRAVGQLRADAVDGQAVGLDAGDVG